ncbi:MAG: tetratricopeptide repeat protein [Myxococcales bacterium]|nr:tetratricopeptide repeat protein [Myxococcales bacterium]
MTLWEALHGRMPPQATHPERLAPFGPATGRIPARLIRLLARGLHPDPALRHASMGELVDALEAVARPRRSWVVALLLAGTAGALVWPSSTPEPTPCTGSDRELERAGTWDELRAAAVSEALARPGLPWSERVREEVDRGLHDYAHAWAREHEAACRATRIDGSESVAVLDLRMLCLDRRRRAFGALVDVLAEADAEVAAQAVQAVDALPSLDGCRDLEALRAPVPLPDDPGDRARADAIFDELGRVEALRQARRFDDALGLATRSVDDAVALGHAPTEADARLARGWVLTDRGELAEAETELRAALHAAEIGRHDHAVTTAWNRLAWVVGYKDARHEEGRRLAAHAEAWSRRHGQDPEAELSRLRTLGWIEHEAGHAERALEHFEAALAVAERLPDDAAIAPQEVALVLNGLGAAALGVADLERASSSFARAGERLEAQLGPDHPDVAQVRNNLSSLLRAQGKSEEARALLAHNLEVFTATFGDEHPLVGQTLINLAVAELDLGLHEASEAHADRALAVLQAAHGPRHPLVSKAHTLRGDARIQLHRPLEAIDDLEHALDIERETLGPEHPSVGIVESNLGGAYYDLERLDEAAEHQLRSIAILEAGLGPEHPNLAFVLTSLGLTRRGQGRPLEALELFRRAERIADPSARADALVRIGETLLELDRVPQAREALEHARTVQGEIEADPGMLGDIGRALARARWAEGEPEAARAAAREAIDAYTRGGDDEQLAEVRRWLAEHSEASR